LKWSVGKMLEIFIAVIVISFALMILGFFLSLLIPIIALPGCLAVWLYSVLASLKDDTMPRQ